MYQKSFWKESFFEWIYLVSWKNERYEYPYLDGSKCIIPDFKKSPSNQSGCCHLGIFFIFLWAYYPKLLRGVHLQEKMILLIWYENDVFTIPTIFLKSISIKWILKQYDCLREKIFQYFWKYTVLFSRKTGYVRSLEDLGL